MSNSHWYQKKRIDRQKKRWSGNIKEWTGLGLKMKSDQGWKGIVAMALQGYGVEYNNRFPKNMYSVFSEV